MVPDPGAQRGRVVTGFEITNFSADAYGPDALQRATEFEAEAYYYAWRAQQEQAALGDGIYPRLLLKMAEQRARWAVHIREANGEGLTEQVIDLLTVLSEHRSGTS